MQNFWTWNIFLKIILQFFQRIRNSNFAFYGILILNFSPKTFGIIIALWTLIKKKMKFSSYIRKFKMEQLQSYIWLTASSYMGKNLRISSYIRKSFLIYDFATAPLWIALYMRKTLFSFLSVKFELCYFWSQTRTKRQKKLTNLFYFISALAGSILTKKSNHCTVMYIVHMYIFVNLIVQSKKLLDQRKCMKIRIRKSPQPLLTHQAFFFDVLYINRR